MKIASLALPMILAVAPAALGQSSDFGPQQLLTDKASSVWSVFAIDLDGDGDADVLSASTGDNTIAWHENLGGGVFGPRQVITSGAIFAVCVYAADLDGDGDPDVLSASAWTSTIEWYENLGAGVFGPPQVIVTGVTGSTFVRSIHATDLDGDGDVDVLSASAGDDKIAWYENLGGGTFGPQQVITTSADGAFCVYAADLDGDGDADVLSASYGDDKIAWYENLGGGAFGPQQVISTAAHGARCVYAIDLDGDGDADVLSASEDDDKIAWYENLGGGAFGPQQVITAAARSAMSVHAADLDGDGDADVLAAAYQDPRITWYENLGGGVFGSKNVITTATFGPVDVYATDLDGDGDADVLSASTIDDKVAWYENVGPVTTTFCTQTKPTSVTGCSALLFVVDYTLATGVWAATDIPRDASQGEGTVVGVFLYTNGVGTGPSSFSAGMPYGTLCLTGLSRSGPALMPGAIGGYCNIGTMDFAVGSLMTPPVAVGEDVNVQLWYRDPTPALAGNANLSNAVFYTVQ
jgi:hypothetical protein